RAARSRHARRGGGGQGGGSRSGPHRAGEGLRARRVDRGGCPSHLSSCSAAGSIPGPYLGKHGVQLDLAGHCGAHERAPKGPHSAAGTYFQSREAADRTIASQVSAARTPSAAFGASFVPKAASERNAAASITLISSKLSGTPGPD